MHDGTCYTNGSYFWDSRVNADTEAISCVLPGTSLTTDQWVRVADPDDPVDCNSNSDSDPFLCTNVTTPDATINLYLPEGLPADQEAKAGTSVVYPLIVQILTLTSSLLIYSVRGDYNHLLM